MRNMATGVLGLMLAAVTACAGDQPAAQEPAGAGAPAKAEGGAGVPDMPGGTGETKDKPAGEGQAAPAAAAPATPPAVEKSQPDVAAAAKAAASSRDKPGAALNLKAGEATVNISLLNVRSGIGTKNPVKRTVKQGEKVTIKECKAGWCQIGDSEWVAGRYLNQ